VPPAIYFQGNSMFKRLETLSGHTKSPQELVASPDGSLLVSAGHDMTLRIWDTATWTVKHVINDMDPGTHQSILTLDISPCGKHVVTGVADFTTKVYSTQTGQRILRLHPLKKSFYNAAELIRFSPTGKYVACAKGKTIELFETETFSKVIDLKGHTSKAHLMKFTPDGRTLISCAGKFMKLWDIATFKERIQLTEHAKLLGSLGVAPNGKFFVTGGEDKRVLIWSLPDAKLVGEYKGHTHFVLDVAVSEDGSRIASWDMDKTLHIWDVGTCKTIATHSGVNRRSTFIPGSNIFIFHNDETWPSEMKDLLVVDAQDGKVVQRLGLSSGGAVAPDGSWLATTDGLDVAIWSKKTK
jgi:WD40 repeat protein